MARYSDIADTHPIVVKEVPVAPEEIKRLIRRIRASEKMRAFVAELIEHVVQDTDVAEEEAWDTCARLAGYECSDDLHGQGLSLNLNVSGFIQVRAKETKDLCAPDPPERS